MTELKIGDEITSVEQLEELPVGAILKHLDYNFPHPLSWVKTGADEWVLDPEYSPISNKGLRMRTYADHVTILDLPVPTDWKIGDTVTIFEETYALPKGVICCPANKPDGVGLARDAEFGDWYATGDDCPETKYEMKSNLPLRILHLPEGDETNDRA